MFKAMLINQRTFKKNKNCTTFGIMKNKTIFLPFRRIHVSLLQGLSVRSSVRPSVRHAFVKMSKKVENGHVGASVVPQGTCLDASSHLYKRVCPSVRPYDLPYA